MHPSGQGSVSDAGDLVSSLLMAEMRIIWVTPHGSSGSKGSGRHCILREQYPPLPWCSGMSMESEWCLSSPYHHKYTHAVLQ
jgi:hypothetical protein